MNKNIAPSQEFLEVWNQLSVQERQMCLDYPQTVKKTLSTLHMQSFVEPIENAAVPERFQSLVEKYTRLGLQFDYSGPVAWHIRQGFTLKFHAPQAGHCYQNLKYLADWPFEDVPTEVMLAFWLPRLLTQTLAKTAGGQCEALSKLRTRLDLPGNHLTSFGSAALLSALILAEFRRSGQFIPAFGEEWQWARTSTRRMDDDMLLCLGGFDRQGLYCDRWDDASYFSNLGVFALGVEKLEPAEEQSLAKNR